jgi:hypothetical protein
MSETVGGSGVWQVTTETSTYVIDLDAGHCVRVPDAGLGQVPGMPPAQVAAMRRDHEPISLVAVVKAEVGHPLLMVLDVRRDGVPTVRRSTVVRQIRRLD